MTIDDGSGQMALTRTEVAAAIGNAFELHAVGATCCWSALVVRVRAGKTAQELTATQSRNGAP